MTTVQVPGVALPGTLVRPSFDCESVEATSDEKPDGEIHSATSGGVAHGGDTVTAEPGDPDVGDSEIPAVLVVASPLPPPHAGQREENDGQTQPEPHAGKSTERAEPALGAAAAAPHASRAASRVGSRARQLVADDDRSAGTARPRLGGPFSPRFASHAST